jgi:pyruvate dehydrogenase E2 component (dihydrolipoamide acetyltransferase)
MRQRGIAPAAVAGTGPGGRILEADVLRTAPGHVPAAGSLSPMRRAVAAKVAESFATVPHFYLRSEVDLTALVELRHQAAETIQQQCGQRPGLTDFLLRAMALALADCPQANRIWQRDTIVPLGSVDLGLVVQVGDGLLVPIIRGADRLGIAELVRQRARLMAAVRSGKTPADIFQGGATSLSNLGKTRVDDFAPVISPPQSSMLAAGRVAQRPAAFEGRLCLRHTVHLTLAVDHRVLDGVPAAEFLDRIAELLENPFRLFVDAPSG